MHSSNLVWLSRLMVLSSTLWLIDDSAMLCSPSALISSSSSSSSITCLLPFSSRFALSILNCSADRVFRRFTIVFCSCPAARSPRTPPGASPTLKLLRLRYCARLSRKASERWQSVATEFLVLSWVRAERGSGRGSWGSWGAGRRRWPFREVCMLTINNYAHSHSSTYQYHLIESISFLISSRSRSSFDPSPVSCAASRGPRPGAGWGWAAGWGEGWPRMLLETLARLFLLASRQWLGEVLGRLYWWAGGRRGTLRQGEVSRISLLSRLSLVSLVSLYWLAAAAPQPRLRLVSMACSLLLATQALSTNFLLSFLLGTANLSSLSLSLSRSQRCGRGGSRTRQSLSLSGSGWVRGLQSSSQWGWRVGLGRQSLRFSTLLGEALNLPQGQFLCLPKDLRLISSLRLSSSALLPQLPSSGNWWDSVLSLWICLASLAFFASSTSHWLSSTSFFRRSPIFLDRFSSATSISCSRTQFSCFCSSIFARLSFSEVSRRCSASSASSTRLLRCCNSPSSCSFCCSASSSRRHFWVRRALSWARRATSSVRWSVCSWLSSLMGEGMGLQASSCRCLVRSFSRFSTSRSMPTIFCSMSNRCSCSVQFSPSSFSTCCSWNTHSSLANATFASIARQFPHPSSIFFVLVFLSVLFLSCYFSSPLRNSATSFAKVCTSTLRCLSSSSRSLSCVCWRGWGAAAWSLLRKSMKKSSTSRQSFSWKYSVMVCWSSRQSLSSWCVWRRSETKLRMRMSSRRSMLVFRLLLMLDRIIGWNSSAFRSLIDSTCDTRSLADAYSSAPSRSDSSSNSSICSPSPPSRLRKAGVSMESPLRGCWEWEGCLGESQGSSAVGRTSSQPAESGLRSAGGLALRLPAMPVPSRDGWLVGSALNSCSNI